MGIIRLHIAVIPLCDESPEIRHGSCERGNQIVHALARPEFLLLALHVRLNFRAGAPIF